MYEAHLIALFMKCVVMRKYSLTWNFMKTHIQSDMEWLSDAQWQIAVN